MNVVQTHQLAGKVMWTWRSGSEPVRAAIIVLGGEIVPRLEHNSGAMLVGFGSIDWNMDITPWPAPGLRKGEDFGGRGRVLLEWMQTKLLPWIREQHGTVEVFIAGYSLGGLMALWCCYELDAFAGCASCSGSLWYDGWDQYVAEHSFLRPIAAYLSLGEAEEKARNPRLARVGDATRRTAALIEADPNAVRTALHFHPGGHFNDHVGRMVDAFNWLLL